MITSETTSFNDQEHAQELINELIADGHDKDEMQEFIETHGHKDFVLYYEDYTRMVDEFDQVTVDSFLECFDLMDIKTLFFIMKTTPEWLRSMIKRQLTLF